MSISLVEIAGANFRTDAESDDLNNDFMRWLGMRKRYLPARLAISRSLAMPSPPEPLPGGFGPGKTIKGDTLFGTGTSLSTWLALIVERSELSDLSTKELVDLVGAHWRRGLKHLAHEWEQSDKNYPQFIRRLMDVAELPETGETSISLPNQIAGIGQVFSHGRIDIPIGEIAEDVNTAEKVTWNLNGKGGSPHCAIMGGVGSGKTRTAVSMLRAIREHSPVPLLAFDFKGDLDSKDYKVDELFEAQVLEPPRMPIPLDVLHIDSQEEVDIAEAASRFRESFGRLKGSRLGAKQHSAIHEAATRALRLAIRNERACELEHIRTTLTNVYKEKEMALDGATSTIQEICRFPLFQPENKPSSFFQKSWIVKLPSKVSEDNRTIVVNLLLDALNQYLNSLPDAANSQDGARGLRILCMVDEAHQILGTKLPSLSSLIRMSRSKGGAIMLISQSPDDFSGEDDEFLSEMGLVGAFATNAAPKNAGRILGKGTNLSSLQEGECFVKRRGDQSSRKIKAW